MPFGEEIGASGEGEKHKFTTYERDGTGLDYAVNRHYDPRQGRFNQVDPLGMGASSLADPQSLNLYSYVQHDPVNLTDPSGLMACYIDGIESNCGMAYWMVQSGAGVIGPLNTTRWDPGLNEGKGGFEHFRAEADGKAGWGHWESVKVRGLDAEGGELWSYKHTEWFWKRWGELTTFNDEFAVNIGGVLRRLDGAIIGSVGGERPIEMQMLGPLDYIGAGEIKAGIAVVGVLGVGGRGLLKSAATAATARLTQQGLEHIVVRHWATSGAQGAGKFAAGTSLKDLKSMINQAVSQGTFRPNTNGRPGIIYELNFGRAIGTDISGGAASNLRVVVSPKGTVTTAFPF